MAEGAVNSTTIPSGGTLKLLRKDGKCDCFINQQDSSEKVFRQGDRLGLNIGDLDSVILKRTKNLALEIINNDEHFFN